MLCQSPPPSEKVPETLCSSSPRPESQEGCVLGRCPKNTRLQWVVSSWSEVRAASWSCWVVCVNAQFTHRPQVLRPPSCCTHTAGAY